MRTDGQIFEILRTLLKTNNVHTAYTYIIEDIFYISFLPHVKGPTQDLLSTHPTRGKVTYWKKEISHNRRIMQQDGGHLLNSWNKKFLTVFNTHCIAARFSHLQKLDKNNPD